MNPILPTTNIVAGGVANTAAPPPDPQLAVRVPAGAEGAPPGNTRGAPPEPKETQGEFLQQLAGKMQNASAPATQDQQRQEVEVSKGGSNKAEKRNTPAEAKKEESISTAQTVKSAPVIQSRAEAKPAKKVQFVAEQPAVDAAQSAAVSELLARLSEVKTKFEAVKQELAPKEQKDQVVQKELPMHSEQIAQPAAELLMPRQPVAVKQPVALEQFPEVMVLEAQDAPEAPRSAKASQKALAKTQDLLAMYEMARESRPLESSSRGSNNSDSEPKQERNYGVEALMSRANLSKDHPRVDVRPVEASITTASVDGASKSVNLRNHWELASAVQDLANKGGGSVKLKLNPNGLGEMTLSVQQGKLTNGRQELNISFRTSNNEAKDVLLGSINELKQSLKARNFDLGAVDVATAANAQEGGVTVSATPSLSAPVATLDSSNFVEMAPKHQNTSEGQGQQSQREQMWQQAQERQQQQHRQRREPAYAEYLG